MYSCQQKEEEIWRFNAVVDGLPNLCSVLNWDPRMTGKAEKEAGRHKGKEKSLYFKMSVAQGHR